MEKKVAFWVDAQIAEKLSTIPKCEKSTIIRMALREWFGIKNERRIVDEATKRS